MKNAREFDNILDECLDRVMKGQDIETILALYPEQATELEPLLRTAMETRKAAAIKPRPEFRQRAGYEFQAAIRDIPPHKTRNAFNWQVRWMAPVALIIVLLLAGGGTVMAASNSMPDSPLYRVKLATESVQLAFTFSDVGKAELYAEFADKRVEEIVKMAEKGNTEQVEKVAERMDSQLIAMANLTSAEEKAAAGADSAKLQAPVAATLTTTPAPTTTETTMTLVGPSVAVTTPPTDETAPPVTINAPPETSEVLSQTRPEGPGYGKGVENNGITPPKPNRNQKLRVGLTRNFEQNLKALQHQLEKAPEPLKSAIQRAIDILFDGYQTNISNLAF